MAHITGPSMIITDQLKLANKRNLRTFKLLKIKILKGRSRRILLKNSTTVSPQKSPSNTT
jgi:hypothetical protein